MLQKPLHRSAGRGLVSMLLLLLAGALTELQAYDCCQPPPDVDFSCDELPYGFDPYDTDVLASLFGEPVEKCSGYWYEELEPEVALSQCNEGTITRKFALANGSGRKFYCSQLVTITSVHDFRIYFPKDASAYCEAPDPEPLIKKENGCDLLAVSVKDELFGTKSSGCYKILRTYRVVNWCGYSGGELPAVKIGRDEDCDGIPGDEGVWVIRDRSGTVFLDRDDNFRNAIPSASENACNGKAGYWKNSDQEPRLEPTGLWEYTQHIKVYDDVQPEVIPVPTEPFCSIGNDCKAPVEVQFGVNEVCSADYLTIKAFFFPDGKAVPLTDANNIAPQALGGAFPNYRLKGRYPLGNHLFEVHVRDGCGNTGVAKIPFTVVDCKAPTPICYHGISLSLMPQEPGTDADGDGDADEFANVVWVTDLLRSQISDCSGPVKYSINRVGETPDAERDNLILTCEDADTVHVEVYAWDSANNPYAVQPDGSVGGPNYDHCKTYIAIREGICPEPAPPARIAGKVKTFTGMPVDQVEIRVSGGMDMMQMTDAEGGYEIQVMPDQAYRLQPFKKDYFMHAVNTGDIMALTSHIMGRKKFDNPYQLIAADVNNSGSITMLDLVLLRKAVLGQMDEFPGTPSWRFIPASYAFPDPLNPWKEPFPEYDYVNQMTMQPRWSNFYAIKVGDVDNSISEENGRSLEAPAYLTVADRYLEAGQSYVVPLALLASSPALAGLQFELYLDPMAITVDDVAEGLLSEAFLGRDRLSSEGTMAVSWNSLDGARGPGAGALFTLHLRALRSGYLHDLLGLSGRRIAPEGYGPDGEIHALQLQFGTSVFSAQLQVDQNYPNPFRETTQVRFYLPEAGPVQLQVFDLKGRLLHSRSGYLDAGEQTFTLYASEWGQTGVLLYTLEAAGQRVSRKMVLLP